MSLSEGRMSREKAELLRILGGSFRGWGEGEPEQKELRRLRNSEGGEGNVCLGAEFAMRCELRFFFFVSPGNY